MHKLNNNCGQVAIDYIVGALGLFVLCILFLYFMGVFQERNINHISTSVEQKFNEEYCERSDTLFTHYTWVVSDGYDQNEKPICSSY